MKNTFIDVADEESPDSMTSFHDGAKTCTARMSETASPARFFLNDTWLGQRTCCKTSLLEF